MLQLHFFHSSAHDKTFMLSHLQWLSGNKIPCVKLDNLVKLWKYLIDISACSHPGRFSEEQLIGSSLMKNAAWTDNSIKDLVIRRAYRQFLNSVHSYF